MHSPPPDRPKQILVICTANICRSPMAKGLLRRKLAEEGLEGEVDVVSAGVMAVEGQPASRHAVEALAERGIDISDHRSHPLQPWLIEEADLILVMQGSHRRAVFHIHANALRKTFLISEMAGEHDEIEDTYGFPLEIYRACADELSRLIAKGMPTMLCRLGVQAPTS